YTTRFRPGLITEADSQPVPAVNGYDNHSKSHHIILIKMYPDRFVKRIRNIRFRYQRQCLRPFQSRFFTVTVIGDFPKNTDAIQALFSLASLPGILGMHINAICAAVYLRGTQFYQLIDAFFQFRIGYIFFNICQSTDCFGGYLTIVESLTHSYSVLVLALISTLNDILTPVLLMFGVDRSLMVYANSSFRYSSNRSLIKCSIWVADRDFK